MGVFEDMANDAGYGYGTDDNALMAHSLMEDAYRQAHEHDEMERYMNELMELKQENDMLKQALLEVHAWKNSWHDKTPRAISRMWAGLVLPPLGILKAPEEVELLIDLVEEEVVEETDEEEKNEGIW